MKVGEFDAVECNEAFAAIALMWHKAFPIDVEIDGGVKADNIADAKAAGANVFVSGSGIFGEKDYGKIVTEMRDLIARADVSNT